MAENHLTGTRLDMLPEVVHQEIVSNLPPTDRLSIGGLNEYWREKALTASNYKQVAICPNSPVTDRSEAGLKLLFEDHALFRLESWVDSIDCIRFCNECANITSLKMVSCEFNDSGDWKSISEFLNNLESLTIEECFLNASDISKIVEGTTSLIELTLVFVNHTIPGLPDIVKSILQKNKSLKHLNLMDFESLYENVSILSSLESIHISVPRGFDEYFWYTLKARCRHSLRKYCCEFFTRDQQKVMSFDNLIDLRIANVNFNLMPEVFSTPGKFPLLQAFTFHHRASRPGLGDYSAHIFRQSPTLQVLNPVEFFREELSVQYLSQLYPQLEFLVLNIMFIPTVITINSIGAMTRLKYLVLHDMEKNPIEDHLLNVIISNSHNLRVLIYRSVHPFNEPFSITLFTITELAIANPDRLYFVHLPGITTFEPENLMEAFDDRYQDIFSFWHDPFASLYSYSTWERLTQYFINELSSD